MRQIRGLFMVAAVVLGGIVAAGPATAVEGCHTINTHVVGTVDFATGTVQGQVIGGGLLHGTVEGSFVFTSVDPNTGTATYEGTYVITTRHGTISFDLFHGVIDLATLTGTNDSVVAGGTGRFVGAGGSVFFEGAVEPDGAFVDYLTGTICFAE